MGKMELDYQKLHDAFFRWQTKPKMSIHGDIYYESKVVILVQYTPADLTLFYLFCNYNFWFLFAWKELETAQPDRKPGDLSKELKEALGMPTDPVCHVNTEIT